MKKAKGSWQIANDPFKFPIRYINVHGSVPESVSEP